jgi:hypothetical protein
VSKGNAEQPSAHDPPHGASSPNRVGRDHRLPSSPGQAEHISSAGPDQGQWPAEPTTWFSGAVATGAFRT